MDHVTYKSRFFICLCSLLVINTVAEYTTDFTSKCPLAATDADIIIAGVFPVHVEVAEENCLKSEKCWHSFEKQGDGTSKCIRINKSGITWVEAMIETIRKINNNDKILPGIKLGYIICDGYNSIDRALNISLMLQSLRHTPVVSVNSTSNTCSCRENDTRTVIGVVGGASSKISMNINYIMNVYDIPQISYSSTSPSLSDKFNYRTFFRTIPPDTFQGKALADVIRHFNWSYVSTVATSDDYGRLGIESFKQAAKEVNMCLAVEELFDKTLSLQATKDEIKRIVTTLKSETKAKVIVLFCEWPSAQAILQEAEKQNLTGKTWIASEAWGENNFVFNIRSDVIGGMLGLIPMGGNIDDFKRHVQNINPRGYNRNTFMGEYLESTIKCMNLTETESNNTALKLDFTYSKCANVMDSVNALAYALHNELGCGGQSGASQGSCNWNGRKGVVDVQGLVHNLKNVTFTGALGVPLSFDANGDPTGSYLITNLQPSKVQHGKMQFARIGRWDGGIRQLLLNNGSKIYWNGWSTKISQSACSKPCKPGYFAIPGKSKCCWECFKCQDGHAKRDYGQTKCVKCPNGFIPNQNRTECIKLIERFLHWKEPIAIVILVTSFLGAVLVLISLILYIRLRETPIVKASSRELSYFLLIALFLIFLTPLVYIGSPTRVMCILRPLCTGLLMTIATSILSVRAYRYLCIFRSKFHLKATKLQSLSSQFISVFACSLLLGAAMAIYFTFYPPQVSKRMVFEKEEANSLPRLYKECNIATQNLNLVLATYLVLLSIICCGLAFQTRKLPEVFNDAKWLAMTMFTQNIVWFGAMTIYIARRNDRAMVMCVNIVISGFVIWIFNFMPKLIMLLIHPERNKKEIISKQIFNMTQRRLVKDFPGPKRSQAIERYLAASPDDNSNTGRISRNSTSSIGNGNTGTASRISTGNISYLNPVALTDILETEPVNSRC